ncbi:MAG TPA: VWA domain-containing protein [Thermoanaerobaculia bacterium]
MPTSAQVPTAGEHIQVTLVEVPVNVVDRAGDAVKGLTLANFELLDNGQHRAITHFDAIDLSANAKKQSGLAAAAGSRNFLLLFDLNNSAPGTLARAREAARNFVNSAGVTGDHIGVAGFSAETGFHLLTSFTSDMKLVSAAVEAVGAPKMFQPADPLLLSSIELREQANLAEQRGTPNAQRLAEDLRDFGRNIERAANDIQRQYVMRTLDAYTEVARLLNRVPGRKQVIILSEGFDAKMIHGREQLSSADARDEQTLIESGSSWRVDTDNRFGNSQAAGDLQNMIEVCRRSDVVLHAIDIRGVRGSTELQDHRPAAISNESLFLLTHDTGGMVFKNTNNIDEDFRRLLRSQEVVYVLGFEAPSNSPGKFHELKVKLVNVPSAHALHRAGYFENTVGGSEIERTLSAAEIITHQIPSSDLGVRMLATPFPRRDGRAQVPVIVEVNGPMVMRAARANHIQSEVFIYAFDEKNIVRDFVHQSMALDVNKLRDRLQRGVRVYETLMLPPGRYSVRALVRAGSQPLYGYNDATIDVPAFDQAFVLGGSAIDEQPGAWVPVKPPDRQGVPRDYPFLMDGASLVPWAAPVLRSGVATRVGLYVDNVPAEQVNVIASIDGQETLVRIASRTTGPDGTAKLVLDFVPPTLPPGEHQLTLRVPGASAHDATVVPFALR